MVLWVEPKCECAHLIIDFLSNAPPWKTIRWCFSEYVSNKICGHFWIVIKCAKKDTEEAGGCRVSHACGVRNNRILQCHLYSWGAILEEEALPQRCTLHNQLVRVKASTNCTVRLRLFNANRKYSQAKTLNTTFV